MESSAAEIFIISGLAAFFGFVLAFGGWLVRVAFGLVNIAEAAENESLSPRQKNLIALSFILVVVGGFVISAGVLGVLISGFLWLKQTVFSELTPKGLAVISVIVGPIPLLLSLFGMLIMKVLGGHADGNGVHVKPVLGIDLSGFLSALFLMHWLTIFTGGLAMLGLMASGVWYFFF